MNEKENLNMQNLRTVLRLEDNIPLHALYSVIVQGGAVYLVSLFLLQQEHTKFWGMLLLNMTEA